DEHKGQVTSVALSPDGRKVASAETTILIRAVTSQTMLPSGPLAADRLLALWTQLADADAAKAHDALWILTTVPRQALPYLEQNRKSAPLADLRRLAALMNDLDANDFAVRKKATDELENLADAVVLALREKMKDKPSPEMRQRLEALLQEFDGPIPSPTQ